MLLARFAFQRNHVFLVCEFVAKLLSGCNLPIRPVEAGLDDGERQKILFNDDPSSCVGIVSVDLRSDKISIDNVINTIAKQLRYVVRHKSPIRLSLLSTPQAEGGTLNANTFIALCKHSPTAYQNITTFKNSALGGL